MIFAQGNNLVSLEHTQSASTKSVVDDFFLHHAPYGRYVKNIDEARRKSKESPPTEEEIARTLSKYFSQVKRVLVPGGKFLITTFHHRYVYTQIVPNLIKAGFKVTKREYMPDEIEASRSEYAKKALDEWETVIRIIAVKPKQAKKQQPSK